MIDQRTGEPYINVWFGNFFRPAYDGEAFIDEAVPLLKSLGFNSVMLDTKAWEDFRERFAGGEASTYVRTQEYMQKRILQEGMTYNHLVLYLNADNLYPNIRFSPPIYGESITNPDGTDGKWYKYWSDKAMDSMVEHVRGVYRQYGDGFTRCRTKNGDTVEVMCTMWDPIVAPSFDSEGKQRYLEWLKRKYPDLASLNAAYHTDFEDFSAIRMEDCWYTTAYAEKIAEQGAFRADHPAIRMWADNMMWKRDELCQYFHTMQKRLKDEASPSIFTCPDMTQWSYFLNVGEVDAGALERVGFSDLWDTANRGIDIYRLAKDVDCAHFITVPVTPYGDPDAYVTSCQHSMMRAMNEGRDLIGGVYWGRFLYQDIYAFLTPCEIIGSMVGAGVDGYTSYGMCGLDDGGVLHRMPAGFQESLRTGNEWAKKVIPMIHGKRKKQAAILFPSAMALLEPMSVAGNTERRYDLLGYYKICCDYGYMADVIDVEMVADGRLDAYEALIIPENDCYELDIHERAEQALRKWVMDGGVVLSSPDDQLCARVFGTRGVPYDGNTSIWYGEGGLPQSDRFQMFEQGECVARYCEDAGVGVQDSDPKSVVRQAFGRGMVYSFGFAYGYSYCAKIDPHVPHSQKNNELYPIPMMKRNIVDDIFRSIGMEKSPVCGKNIETAVFEDGIVVINHSSVPTRIDLEGEKLFQYEIDGHMLLPRSAVYIKTA